MTSTKVLNQLQSPSAIQVADLPASVVTSTPVQLNLLTRYSDGSETQSIPRVNWTADGVGSVTQSGLFACTGFGSASVRAQLGQLIDTAHTSCLNSPLPQLSGVFIERSETFAGPFSSWLNVRSVYGAKGDGISDDTIALQAALDDQPTKNKVIWIPRGTYRISRSLSSQQCIGLTIIGEDPTSTTVRWEGPADGTMLELNGCTRFEISRLTFDGSNTAAAAEHISSSNSLSCCYPTFNVIGDQVIKNVKIGLRLGFAGEITINRIHFSNNSVAGIRQEDPNSLNIFIRDSLFSDCGKGITNIDGAGGFNVSNSVFARSRVADMMIGNTGPFAIRRSLSVGSRAFFIALNTGAPASIVFEGNHVLAPSTVPIQIGTPSPILLLDNRFYRMNPEDPILTGTACCGTTDVLSAGNQAASVAPFKGKIGRVRSIDDVFSSPSIADPPEAPTSVYRPVTSPMSVFDIPSGANFTAIQEAVTKAAHTPGGGIVHLSTGRFQIDHTIEIPDEEPVQIIGDGPFATSLESGQALNGAIVRSESSHLTIAELQIHQLDLTEEAVQLLVRDDPATHVLIEAIMLDRGERAFMVDGIDQATIEAFSGQIATSRLSGGPILGSGAYGFGRINLFQSGTHLLDLQNGARLVEEDFWKDDNEPGSAIALNGGSGSIAVSGGALHTIAPVPTIAISDFNGDVSLTTVSSTSPIELSQITQSTDVLLAASAIQFTESPVLATRAAGKIAGILNANVTGNHPVSTNDFGETSPQWIEHMLGPVRTQHPRPRLPLENTAARIRIRRVYLASTATGIHILPKYSSGSVGPIGYSVTSRNGDALSSTAAPDCVSQFPGSTGTEWIFASSFDGGVNIQQSGKSISIANSTTDQNVRMSDTSLGDARQEWIVLAAGDGFFRILNRVTGGALTSTSPGSCAVVSPSNGGEAQEWSISPGTL